MKGVPVHGCEIQAVLFLLRLFTQYPQVFVHTKQRYPGRVFTVIGHQQVERDPGNMHVRI